VNYLYKEINLSDDSFSILLRVASQVEMLSVSVIIIIVGIISDLKQTDEAAYGPQPIVIHCSMPL